VTTAGEDHSGDAAIPGSKKNEAAFFKGHLNVAAAEFDAVGFGDAIDSSGIDTQSIELLVGFVRGFFRCGFGNLRREIGRWQTQ